MSENPELSLDGGQLLSKSPPHLLLLKVFKVDTLLSISGQKGGGGGGEEDVTILSPVVSLFAKNFNNRFLPLGLNITMKHLVATGKRKVGNTFGDFVHHQQTDETMEDLC